MEKRMYNATCSNCDEDTEVPFKPDGKRPVYCRGCFQKQRVKNEYKNNKRFGGKQMSRYREDEDEEYWEDD